MLKKGKKTSNAKDEATSLSQTGRSEKYRRDPPSSHGADYIHTPSTVVRHVTAVKRSDHVPTGPNSSKTIRSLSVPSLHATTAEKVRYSPPSSPPKPRSKSVRVHAAAKKASSFKKNLRKFFHGSTLELDETGTGLNQRVIGTYRPLNCSRPRSIGGSSDCSNSSTYTADFSRCNSLRDSSRSRISHGNDNVFQTQQHISCDSNDCHPFSNHAPSGSTDSTNFNFKIPPLHHTQQQQRGMVATASAVGGETVIQRSSSSTSLKNFGIQTKVGVTDPRYHSVATDGPYLEERIGVINSSGGTARKAQMLRHYIAGRPGQSMDDTESLWEDSKSFTFLNKSVVPSDPEYRQVAENLMSASPTHKAPPINDASSHIFGSMVVDPRRMSDAGMDPRRASLDSEVESSSVIKHNRSLPTTPISRSFTTAHAHNEGDLVMVPPREGSITPHGYHSQESSQSVPHGWDIAYTQQGLRYYLDHNTETTHWELPHNPEDSLGLPPGWEAVRSGQYGTYYVNHNNKTAIYQHPFHARPPPPYKRPPNMEEEDDFRGARGERKTPARSHSHRSSQSHRVLDLNSPLLRRSKSVRDQEIQYNRSGLSPVTHERQLSVVTYVPPNPYQSKEIPQWLKEYVEAPFDNELDLSMQSRWWNHSYNDLTGWDTMIKRLLKKDCEHVVKACEYYRVAIQQENDDRVKQKRHYKYAQQQQQSLHQQAVVGAGGEEQRQYLQQHHLNNSPSPSSSFTCHHPPSPYLQQGPLSYYQPQQQKKNSPSPSSSFAHHQSPHLPVHSILHLPASLRPGHTQPLPSSSSAMAPPLSPQQKAAAYHHHPPSSHHPPLSSLHPTTTIATISSSSSSSSSSSVVSNPTIASSALKLHHPPSSHYLRLHHQPPQPLQDHMCTRQIFDLHHHDSNESDSHTLPAGKFDTMIEKPHHLQDVGSATQPLEASNSAHSHHHHHIHHRHPASPGNNGLPRVDGSKVSPFSTAAAKSHSKGFPPCADVPVPRQGGSGFTDLFEGTNVQETFV